MRFFDYKSYSWAVIFCYGLFLVLFLVFDSIGEIALYLTLIFPLLFSSKIKAEGFSYIFYDKLVVVSFLSFFLTSLLSLLIQPINDQTLARNELMLFFLLVVPLYYYLRVSKNSVDIFLYFSAIAGCFVGIVSVFQLVYTNSTGEFILTNGNRFAETLGRPSGSVHPMRFGALSLCIFLICFNGFLFLRYSMSKLLYLLLFSGSVLAFVACILAQSRGSWLAIPVLAIAYLVYFGVRSSVKTLIIIFVSISIVLLGVINTPQFEKRYNEAIGNVQSYREGNANTSLGARFDMAKAAWILIKEKPVLGHGLGSYKDLATDIRIENPGMSYEVGMWKNPHNEILLVMVERGIPGLASLLFLFGALAFVYWRYAWRVDTAFYGVTGIGILIVYAVAGQSVALFEHEPFTYFFTSTHVFLVASMLQTANGVKKVNKLSNI